MAGALAPVTIAGNPNIDVSDIITSMEVSLTLDEASQLTIRLIDPGLERYTANYFQIRQQVTYIGIDFEVAAIDLQQGSSGPEVTLTCRPQKIQALKRDKGRAVFTGGSGAAYAAAKAREVGLAFFGENAAPKTAVTQVANNSVDESSWDVLKRVASENGFVCFESDGRLFFCSEPFLLGKFALLRNTQNPGFLATPVIWNSTPLLAGQLFRFGDFIPGPPERVLLALGAKGPLVGYAQKVLVERAAQTILEDRETFGSTTEQAVKNLQGFFGLTATGSIDPMTWNLIDYLANGVGIADVEGSEYYLTPLGLPSLRRSENAQDGRSLSMTVQREQGKLLRPGMTIALRNVPHFDDYYLITEVSWEEGVATPVSVSARTLVEPLPTVDGLNEDLNRFRASLSMTGGGYATVAGTVSPFEGTG